jgi:hypothetical protein
MCKLFGCCDVGERVLSTCFYVVWSLFCFVPRILLFLVFVAPIHYMNILLMTDWIGLISGFAVAFLLSFVVVIPMAQLYTSTAYPICIVYLMSLFFIVGHLVGAFAILMKWVQPRWKSAELRVVDPDDNDTLQAADTSDGKMTLHWYDSCSFGAFTGAVLGLALAFPQAALRVAFTEDGQLSHRVCDPTGQTPTWLICTIMCLAGVLNTIMGPVNNKTYSLSRRVFEAPGLSVYYPENNGNGHGNTNDTHDQLAVQYQPHITELSPFASLTSMDHASEREGPAPEAM